MSYTQIEIGGKKRGLKFNNFAFNAAVKKKLPGFEEETAGYALFYGGLIANCYAKNEQPDFTFEESMEWYDTLTPEQGEAITKAISETDHYKSQIEKTETEEDKKKLTTESIGEKPNE